MYIQVYCNKFRRYKMTDGIYFNVRCQSKDSRDYLRKLAKLEAAKRDMNQEQILYYALQFLNSYGGRYEKEGLISYNLGK